ncbi:MAG: OmpA family protein [candidate division WOR-3 bacterium]|nr:OmpA family protein [candidate division WOR-3 bacterium]MDW7987144.1 OmpA family protein [candidate division WOR-3 bacterium]
MYIKRKNQHLVLVLLLFVFLIIGCPKKAVKPQIIPPPPVEEKKEEEIKELPKIERLQTIYFDFDKSDIRSDAAEILKKNAQILKDNPNINIIIEGHCCPIGTSEYNMALGWRRANAAFNYLIKLGIPKERMTTISYGEERLITENPNEYYKNRRCEFIVK